MGCASAAFRRFHRTIGAVPAFRNLGLALVVLRWLAGKSQADLAQAAGCGKSQLSKYETGKELPKLDTLDRLLASLGVSPMTLFFVVSFLDGLEQAPRADRPHEALLQAVLPRFGGEDEAALGRLLTGLVRSLLAAQEDRLAAELRRLRGEGLP